MSSTFPPSPPSFPPRSLFPFPFFDPRTCQTAAKLTLKCFSTLLASQCSGFLAYLRSFQRTTLSSPLFSLLSSKRVRSKSYAVLEP